MPSTAQLYNQEVLEGHREALAALRELLAAETDPTERRRLATAILRTRKVKDPQADAQPQPAQPSTAAPQPEVRSATPQPPTDFFNPLNPLSPLNPLQAVGAEQLPSSTPHQPPDAS